MFSFDGKTNSIQNEMQDAGTWVKHMIAEVEKDHDVNWREYPLIQKDPILLRNEHLNLYSKIRSNPTADLYQLCMLSGYGEQKFYEIINDLIRKNYLRILATYFSPDINRYVEPLFYVFLLERIRRKKK